MTVTNKRLVEILTTAMEKPEIANALIQRVINTLNRQGEREWQGLTDEDKKQIAMEANNKSEMSAWEYAQRVGNFTEAKLKEKNSGI